MTCRDCINYSSCLERGDVAPKELMEGAENDCELFKNKSDYAEVKHGEWLECLNELHKYCSVCNKVFGTIYDMKPYCPNCGAKMNAKNDFKE